jgi:hypothetical protein
MTGNERAPDGAGRIPAGCAARAKRRIHFQKLFTFCG